MPEEYRAAHRGPSAPTEGSQGPASAKPGSADASPDSARTRLWRAMRTPTRAQAVVAVLLALVGFASVVQVRDRAHNDAYAGFRQQDLIEVLNGLTGTAERARREVDRLEAARDRLESENTSRRAALEEAKQRVQTLNIIAGLVPVTGPGLRITIKESTGRVTLTSLLDLVQELRTAGAEAMEFNDQWRLAAQSSFETTVGGVMLDGHLLEPPYVVDVIGDPHTLHGALTFGSGPIEQLEGFDGATVEVEELSQVDIESVRQPIGPVNAEADTGQ